MSTSVASDFETPRPSRRGGAKKAVIVVAKLLVTGACFWYVSRQIDWRQVLSAIPLLDLRWTALAILVAMLEIPLSGLRWYNIVDSLGARDEQMTRIAMIARPLSACSSPRSCRMWRARGYVPGCSFGLAVIGAPQ